MFERPIHPYTVGLLEAVPSLESYDRRLAAIPGQQPDLAHLPQGCRFEPRCRFAVELCRTQYPDWFEWNDAERRTACWLAEERLQGCARSGQPCGVRSEDIKR